MSTNRVTWTCDECGEPIRPGYGYLNMDYRALHAHQKAVAAWKAEAAPRSSSWDDVDMVHAFRQPKSARWRVLHTDCEMEPLAGYSVAVERADTAEKVLDWTCHLAEKGWLEDTDWLDLVRNRVLRPLGVDA